MSIRWRPRTVRMRLTLLYASLFLSSGVVLVALVVFLVLRRPVLATFAPVPPPDPGFPALSPPQLPVLAGVPVAPTWRTVRELLLESGLVLAVMTAASAGLGWAVAGRVLRPLEHAFEAQRRFIANASHELRTPLAMIRTSVDVALAKPRAPKEIAVLAGKLHEGLDSADRLLEGLLLLARAQNHRRAETSVVWLSELALSALAARAGEIAEKGLTVQECGNATAVRGNAVLLGSLVDNLVDNAVRHNDAGGWLRVTIGTGGDGGRARFTVENGGAVLSQRDVDLLGQPFQRLGSARTSGEGTGLGLSIAAAVATAHGGRLSLYARPEGGLRAEAEL